MKALKCNIKIGRYVFEYVVDLKVKADIENLTDTCDISLPRKLVWEGKNITLGESGLIKAGNKVTVKTGYGKAEDVLFTGYVKTIKSGTRINISCENEMYLLKTGSITKSYTTVKLATLLKDILPAGTKFQAFDIELGQLRITKATPAEILKELKENYGIYSYFREGMLYGGMAYWPELSKVHIFHFQKNIALDGHPDFVKAEDLKLKVKAISIMPDNSRVEAEICDNEGEERTLHFYNVPEKDLKAATEKELSRLKYDGLRGSFTAFGEPLAQKGDVASMKDDITPEREGSYLIKSIEYSFGQNGYRQIIELANKV